MTAKFYQCKHCKNLIGMVNDSGVVPMCCGEKMNPLEANTTDASQEKHVPCVELADEGCGTSVHVTVGSAPHPMTREHLIEWIFVETTQGGHRRALCANDAPEATFILPEGESVNAVYAFCNLHGLWKTTV